VSSAGAVNKGYVQSAVLAQRATTLNAGTKIENGVRDVVIGLLALVLICAGFLAYSASDSGVKAAVGAAVTMLLVFVAAGFVGVGLGFLFGMPRSRFADQISAPGTDGDAAQLSGQAVTPLTRPTRYLTNSNFIKVSDWFTTIVVGLALVNIGHAVAGLRALASALQKPLGDTPYAGAVGLALLIIGAVAGFAGMYLWTSVRVRELFEESEQQIGVVPNLVGCSIADARAIIGWTPFSLESPPQTPDTSVITNQLLDPGVLAPRGATVKVEV
jgi:hypothetical protein